MRRFALAVAFTALAMLIVAPLTFAEPLSVLGKLIGAYTKIPGRVIEVKRDKGTNIAWVMLLVGDEVKCYKHPPKGKREEMKPTREYDIEKLKELKIGAGKAHELVRNYPPLAGSPPVLRSIELRTLEDGKLQYVVHVYSSTGGHRGAWLVDIDKAEVLSKKLYPNEIDDPLEETWGVPFDEEESSEEG
jgi:hypothetical protein